MSKTSRWNLRTILIGVLVVLAGAAIVQVVSKWPSDGVNEANSRKIKEGMSLAEVESLLASPMLFRSKKLDPDLGLRFGWSPPEPWPADYWQAVWINDGDTGRIYVWFDGSNHVVAAGGDFDFYPSFWSKIRGWLGL
jgi:hypothetical protein